MKATLEKLSDANLDSTLQLTCVYGQFIPKLANILVPRPLYITDVCIHQLYLVRRKTQSINPVFPALMNAESLGYQHNSFTTIIVFFLLHELPADARQRVLSECMRVIKTGGSLVITEYGPLPEQHWLYRIRLTRWLITYYEPFLDSFWRDDITRLLIDSGKSFGKSVEVKTNTSIFNGFYRVTEFKICPTET